MIKKDKFLFTAPLEESGGVSSSALGRCGRRENIGKLATFSCLSLVVRRRMTWWWRVDSWAKLLGSDLCSTLLAVWPGTYYFTSLHLVFLIYKVKVTQPHRIFLRTKWLNTCKVFRVWLSKYSMSVVYGDFVITMEILFSPLILTSGESRAHILSSRIQCVLPLIHPLNKQTHALLSLCAQCLA